MFEPAYKNKGLVNFMFKSISRTAIGLMNTKILHAHQAEMLEMLRTPRGKSALSPPGAKSAPRSSKSIIFVKGNVQLFNLQKML